MIELVVIALTILFYLMLVLIFFGLVVWSWHQIFGLETHCAIFIAHCGNEYSARSLKEYLTWLASVWQLGCGKCCWKIMRRYNLRIALRYGMKTKDSGGCVVGAASAQRL